MPEKSPGDRFYIIESDVKVSYPVALHSASTISREDQQTYLSEQQQTEMFGQ